MIEDTAGRRKFKPGAVVRKAMVYGIVAEQTLAWGPYARWLPDNCTACPCIKMALGRC